MLIFLTVAVFLLLVVGAFGLWLAVFHANMAPYKR